MLKVSFNNRKMFSITILIIVILTGIALYPFFISEPNPATNFKGSSESFNFIGQYSYIQFKAKEIILLTRGTKFFSVNNITIESSNGEIKLINYSYEIYVSANEGVYQQISNAEVDMIFENLTLTRGVDYYSRINPYNSINLSGKLGFYPHSLKSNGGDVIIRQNWGANYVLIGNENITDFKQISFEMQSNIPSNNMSWVDFYPELTELRANDVSDLKIRSQLSKIALSQSEGVLGLGDHTFYIKSSDIFNAEILPEYQTSSFLSIDGIKMSFNGLTKSNILNNKNLIQSDLEYWLSNQPEKINAYAVVILVILTLWYAFSTHSLLNEQRSILDEQRKTRKITAIEKKLEQVYSPFEEALVEFKLESNKLLNENPDNMILPNKIKDIFEKLTENMLAVKKHYGYLIDSNTINSFQDVWNIYLSLDETIHREQTDNLRDLINIFHAHISNKIAEYNRQLKELQNT